MVIREALRLAQDEIQPSPVQKEIGNQGVVSTVHRHDLTPGRPVPEPANAASTASAVLRMFDAMGKIFADNCKEDTIYRGLQIDRKRLKELREWKRSRGIKSDEEELRIN